jgi:hypothetical protein
MEVADLATADPEPELAAATDADLDARPRRDLGGDAIARRVHRAHACLLCRSRNVDALRYKLK